MQRRHPYGNYTSTIAALLLTAAFVVAALASRSPTPPASLAAVQASPNLSQHVTQMAAASHGPSSFGYLEFDWTGGVPGFDPLPDGPPAANR